MEQKALLVCNYLNSTLVSQRHRPSGLAQFRFEPPALRTALMHAGVAPAVISELYGKTVTGADRTMLLPFGISVNITAEGGASIESDLEDQFTEDQIDDLVKHCRGIGAAEGLEAFLLALAAEGVDLESEAIGKAFTTAVESIAQNL